MKLEKKDEENHQHNSQNIDLQLENYRALLTGRRQSVFYKDKYSLLRTELDPFPDNINKLTHSQIGWHEISEFTPTE
jgi:small-conductance mechanosensitive channel